MDEEIPREKWPVFLDQFSRQHKDWLVTVEIDHGTPLEDLDEAIVDQPLQDIFMDKGDHDTKIVVVVGDDEIPFDVLNPTGVVVEHSESGGDKGLRIEGGLGYATLIRFRVPAPPEVLNGILEPK